MRYYYDKIVFPGIRDIQHMLDLHLIITSIIQLTMDIQMLNKSWLNGGIMDQEYQYYLKTLDNYTSSTLPPKMVTKEGIRILWLQIQLYFYAYFSTIYDKVVKFSNLMRLKKAPEHLKIYNY